MWNLFTLGTINPTWKLNIYLLHSQRKWHPNGLIMNPMVTGTICNTGQPVMTEYVNPIGCFIIRHYRRLIRFGMNIFHQTVGGAGVPLSK